MQVGSGPLDESDQGTTSEEEVLVQSSPAKTSTHSSDRWFGAVMTALALVTMVGANNIQESFIQDPLGPKMFPWMISAVLGICGLVLVVRPDPSPIWPNSKKLVELGGSVFVLCAYAQWLSNLGFVISTSMASAFISWRLGSSPKEACIAGVILGVLLYSVFGTLLGLSLARGPWGF